MSTSSYRNGSSLQSRLWMTLRNSSMPNFRPPRWSSSITANLSVCMCTVGVSEYSSTASHPLSLFTALPPTWRSLYNRFGPRERPASVNLVEEQADCGRHRPGAGAVDHVECVARTRELHVADHRMRLGTQPLDEASRLFDRYHAVAGAVDHEERRRIVVHLRDRR